VAAIEFYGITPPTSGGTGNVPTPPPAAIEAPVAVLTLLEQSVTVGAAIHAHAVGSTLNSGTPLTARYEWDFGDPSSKYNKLTGFNAAHIYDKPGTYTITLKVTDDAGRSTTATQVVTVTADSRRTIYVDSVNGNDANNGLSPGAAVRTANRAFAMLSDNTKILFARGGTYPVTSSLYATYKNNLIGAYGTGASPTLLWRGGAEDWWEMIACGSTTRDLVIQDLVLDSGTATRPNGIAPRGTNITIRNCQFYRLSTAINCAGSPTGLLVQDNAVPQAGTISAYFLWLQGNDSVILGNKVADGGMYAIRSSGIDGETNRSLIAYNELNHVTGSVNLRLQKGSYYYVANNTINGKGVDFGPNGGGLGYNDPNYKTVRTNWVVMENNVAYMGTGLSENNIKVSHRAQHVMIRNNVIFRDGLGETFSINGYQADYGASAYDVYILNNTVTNNGTTGTFLKMTEADLTPEVTVANNVWRAPNQIAGKDGSAILWINDPTLVSFKAIRDNLWGNPTTDNYANGGVIYVMPTNGGTGLLTPAQWVLLGMVQDDQFQSLGAAVVGTYQYTVNGVTAGANYVPSA
jgi:PKD repeat protein